MGAGHLMLELALSLAAKALSRRRGAMSGNRLRVRGAFSLILILSLAPVQACGVATPTNSGPLVSSESPGKYDLSGVWTGISITGCTPLRMNGPWRCGARADLMLTFFREDTAAITGIYASDRAGAGDAFQETGRIVEAPQSGPTRLWLRVTMRDHSSCLFTSNLRREEMKGSYICFRNGTPFERGRWVVRRSY
jgi:hypothetical protein